MTPKERREGHIRAMEPGVGAKGRHLNDTDATRRYDKLLAYFDEHEPAVADAIRFGVNEHRIKIPVTLEEMDRGIMPKFIVRYSISYPEGHEKR